MLNETHQDQESPNEPNRTVLIIEDDPPTREIYKSILETLPIKCEVLECWESEKASLLVQTKHPDLILLDIVLPGSKSTGVMLCREFCRNPLNRVVVVSGQADEVMVQSLLSMGATDIIHKPFSLEDLQNRFKSWLM